APPHRLSSHHCPAPHRLPPSSPTRRSSDLLPPTLARMPSDARQAEQASRLGRPISTPCTRSYSPAAAGVSDSSSAASGVAALPEIGRAHVELQSLTNLVCRLLLEKKKTNTA